jgi:hypothetical protein
VKHTTLATILRIFCGASVHILKNKLNNSRQMGEKRKRGAVDRGGTFWTNHDEILL